MRTHIVEQNLIKGGVPIPEMIGGAIIGVLVSLVLTYSPELRFLLDPQSPLLYVTLVIAAVAGAAVSFFLAREPRTDADQLVGTLERRRAA